MLRVTLETERLILTNWIISDWTSLRRIATDPEVMRYITGGCAWTDEQTQSFVDRHITLYRERGFCRWKLLDKSDGDFVGFCGVGFWRDAPDPEIGWWLSKDRWGRGFATEAGRAALSDALQRVRLDRIISVAMRENAASIHVMQKLGLSFDCEFENGGFQLVRYAITRSSTEHVPVEHAVA